MFHNNIMHSNHIEGVQSSVNDGLGALKKLLTAPGGLEPCIADLETFVPVVKKLEKDISHPVTGFEPQLQ